MTFLNFIGKVLHKSLITTIYSDEFFKNINPFMNKNRTFKIKNCSLNLENEKCNLSSRTSIGGSFPKLDIEVNDIDLFEKIKKLKEGKKLFAVNTLITINNKKAKLLEIEEYIPENKKFKQTDILGHKIE